MPICYKHSLLLALNPPSSASPGFPLISSCRCQPHAYCSTDPLPGRRAFRTLPFHRVMVHLAAATPLLNARSIQNKDVLLADICDDVRPDFFAITETWLTPEHGDSVLMKSCPDGYTALHRPRTSTRAVYRILVIHLSSIFLSLRPRPIPLIIMYRPASKSSSAFLDEFAKLLDAVVLSDASFLIVGDLNYHVDGLSDPSVRNFVHLIESLWASAVFQLSNPHAWSHIDLVIARAADNLIDDVSTGSFFSEEASVFCSIPYCLPPCPTKRLTFSSYKSFSLDSFLSDLSALPLIVEPSTSLNLLVEQYNGGLRSLL
ncbi:hypothetical protein DAPPUDRAFT_115995 [Daphnia pulex]|uniref:Endonuclease/exonuclease/phosphatase domain-containing protein n=1 Tax=Daphnia pulex TaxID=6669 RepID=E9HN78_DAPPU|nr:hypothetical protein DAPPUDRAFT_115995 [Daphnia pulex]|eukprot:EFX66806.1 hypothetical protein DAPPUDRAFT_115995 [Daphnia pulex]